MTMHLSEKCPPFKLALIAQSYGLLDGVQNSCTWHFYEVWIWERSVGKNSFRGVFYFMSFSVTLGKTSPSPAL